MRRDLICALALALAGCGAGSAFVPPLEDHSPPPRHPEPELARRPYTADAIRAASPEGRWMRYRIIAGDAPAKLVEYRFVAVDADGATIDETGVAEPQRQTWIELEADGSFPEKSTEITAAHVTVAAGGFDCDEYVVTQVVGKARRITTLDFATAMPGPPVRMRIVTGPTTELSMELVAFGGVGAAP